MSLVYIMIGFGNTINVCCELLCSAHCLVKIMLSYCYIVLNCLLLWIMLIASFVMHQGNQEYRVILALKFRSKSLQEQSLQGIDIKFPLPWPKLEGHFFLIWSVPYPVPKGLPLDLNYPIQVVIHFISSVVLFPTVYPLLYPSLSVSVSGACKLAYLLVKEGMLSLTDKPDRIRHSYAHYMQPTQVQLSL